MKHETFFRRHPVFTSEEFDIYLSSLGKTGPRTRESVINYHRNTGHIIQIRRGLFAVIPRGENPDSYPVDPFLVAAKLTKDSMWPVTLSDSYPIGAWMATQIPILDIHELAAGKLAALLARRQARDLFDTHRILTMEKLNHDRLRTAFVVYGTMNRKDWRTVLIEDLNFESAELVTQ